MLIAFIILKIVLNTAKMCSGLISFTKTKTAMPLANFNGILIGKAGRTVHRGNLLNILAKPLYTNSTKVTTTILSKLIISFFTGPGDGWGAPIRELDIHGGTLISYVGALVLLSGELTEQRTYLISYLQCGGVFATTGLRDALGCCVFSAEG